MAMQQCPNGHLYDDSRNSSCPYCNGVAADGLNVTVPLGAGVGAPVMGADPIPMTVGIDSAPAAVAQAEISPTMPLDTEQMKTVYVQDEDENEGSDEKVVDKVRGWLICVKGSKRGMDFRLHSEKNTNGRGNDNDVNISFDSSVSKGVNAIIAYDRKTNKFFIYPEGVSKNNIYVNEGLLMMPVEIKDYDRIEVGSTQLIFRSLCNDQFNW